MFIAAVLLHVFAKVEDLVRPGDSIVITRINNGLYENVKPVTDDINDSINEIRNFWCLRKKRHNMFRSSDSISVFCGDWFIVLSEEQSYLYSMSTGRYYIIIGSASDIYRDILLKITKSRILIDSPFLRLTITGKIGGCI